MIYFIVPVCLTSQISAEKRLKDYVDLISRDKNFSGSLLSIKLINCDSGTTIFEFYPDLMMIPASILKVITTGTGLINLGKDYFFRTSLFHDGTIAPDSVLNGNLYVVGGGDPSFGSKNFPKTLPDTVFKKIVQGLKNAGLTKINGKILIDNSYFDGIYSTSETIHPSWEWEDIGSHYGAGVHGLNFCENAFAAKILCKDSAKVEIRLEYPYSKTVMPEIVSDIIIVHKDSLANVVSFSSPTGNKYVIRGEIPLGKELDLNCALQNPSGVFEFWLKKYLNSNGITIYKGIDSVSNRERRLITEIKSPPFHELAKFTNYVSNNLFADAVFKNISKIKTGDASFSKSSENMTELLKSLKLNMQNIRIIDGSGLSRRNFVTTEFMCKYLRAVKAHIPDFHLFLPSPGTDKSTLRSFMSSYSGKENKERIFLKSGSMTGVLNYAGYIVNKKGETMCVAIMTNNFIGKTKDLRPKLEKLIYLISEL